MPFSLPPLHFAEHELEPHISAETVSLHYGAHHRGYVEKLNARIAGSDVEGRTLETLESIVKSASGDVFDNAAQAWNHSFYWACLSSQRSGTPSGNLAKALDASFGSFERFRDEFTQQSTELFGSGWVWLVELSGGELAVLETENAGTPITGLARPLLTCDLWEHAYYLDYRNERARYLEGFWRLVDWERLTRRFERGHGAWPAFDIA